MSSIRLYLPSLRRAGGGRTSDFLVHPTALAHLRRKFNNICTSLLRNDSLTDMSDRSAVYFELFEWLEVCLVLLVNVRYSICHAQTISNHEALASMMAMPIMVVSSTRTNTPKRSTSGSPPLRERTIIYEGSAGPRELLESIVIQANAAIKGLEGAAKPTEVPFEEMTEEQKRVTNDTKGKAKEIALPILSEDNHKLLKFCQRILATAQAIDRSLRETKGDAFVERLLASLPKISSSSSAEEVRLDADASDETTQKAYIDWATKVRFEYCDLTVPPTTDDQTKTINPDEPPSYKFYYNTEARMLASSDIPKRSLAIAKEVFALV